MQEETKEPHRSPCAEHANGAVKPNWKPRIDRSPLDIAALRKGWPTEESHGEHDLKKGHQQKWETAHHPVMDYALELEFARQVPGWSLVKSHCRK